MSKFGIDIRLAKDEDALNLALLKQQVWIATYAAEGIRSEFSNYVFNEFTVENTKQFLRNTNKITLIAENKEHLIACADLSFDTQCPIKSIEAPEISVLYVLDRFHGSGIGKLLLNESLHFLKEMNHKQTWLTVYHKNFKAIKFYQKNNFKAIGETHFEMEGNKYKNEVMLRDTLGEL